tara:strand:- start:2682 stop:3425 length:744 start_codon:yes stop_codon:yes gene_type:complete
VLNFSDPNEGQRRKEAAAEGLRRWKYADAVAKYHNKGTSLKINRASNAMGLSRAKSDLYATALHAQNTAWKAKEAIKREALTKTTYAGEGSSNRAGKNVALELLSKQNQLENMVKNGFGRNMDIGEQKVVREKANKDALAIEKRGLSPQYGPPAFQTPRNELGKAMNIANSVVKIAGLAAAPFTSGASLKLTQSGIGGLGGGRGQFNPFEEGAFKNPFGGGKSGFPGLGDTSSLRGRFSGKADWIMP